MKERTMALAGIFQATELVRQAANHGTWSGYAADTCLESLLAIEADSVEDIFGSAQRLRLGAETLISVLQGDRRYMESLGYAVSIMQLENNFRKKGTMQARIGTELQYIAEIDDGTEIHEIKDLQAKKIAQLYTQTISTIAPRIVINGRPQHLQIDRTVNWIRTLLFAGLRSAVLWRQMGGGRFSLMFGRKKMLEQAETLLPG
ncbi:MAG: high frequency lysogenization protein HflD [Gammaproteobacteria bacterium]|jgi:high frequency lysogenization protein|nr:high frequency lysogenization protein HflD [Gammaproteobacteria bacterium]MBT8075456.1 high frequency lysogenization protein HflD [Gammaproteobacteria bacterium]NNK99116.1 high frequency lysogenization protein HflD [Xanthomonadales bacterium]